MPGKDSMYVASILLVKSRKDSAISAILSFEDSMENNVRLELRQHHALAIISEAGGGSILRASSGEQNIDGTSGAGFSSRQVASIIDR